MQSVISVAILAIMLIGSALVLLGDTDASTAHANIANKEATRSMSKASNSSASTATTAEMYAVSDD